MWTGEGLRRADHPQSNYQYHHQSTDGLTTGYTYSVLYQHPCSITTVALFVKPVVARDVGHAKWMPPGARKGARRRSGLYYNSGPFWRTTGGAGFRPLAGHLLDTWLRANIRSQYHKRVQARHVKGPRIC